MKRTAKRIESDTSRTAEFTVMMRSASFYEKRPQYKSNDYIAPKILPKFFLIVVRIGLLRNLFKKIFPRGLYEYVIARTKFIDSIFKRAILNEFDQILIFGAGFDSRGIRFADLNKKTKIFELDAPLTQEAKINQLKKRGVETNPNIIFIPIDFNRESLDDKLLKSGFKKNQKSLFILEGLTMYLNPEAINDTFDVINKFAGNNSEVVFDYVYASVLREENLYYGESDIFQRMKKENEPWTFGIEAGAIKLFLNDKNLKLIQNLNSKDLEKEFFKDEQKNIIAKVNGTHAMTYAKIGNDND